LKLVVFRISNFVKILFFGDIFAQPGRAALRQILPSLKKKYDPDVVLADVDNAAHGRGITAKALQEVLDAGVDYVSAGNHAFDRDEAWALFENEKLPLLRPANFPSHFPGKGYAIIQLRTQTLLFIHLLGRVSMRPEVNDPIETADKILSEYSLKSGNRGEGVSAIFVDWHTEVTSESQMLAWYLDGKVSAILGTHTHVQTADNRILPKGTAYMTDVGMVGPMNSVIGMDPQFSINHFRRAMPLRLEPAAGPVQVCGAFVDIDSTTGKATQIERIFEVVEKPET
jgi:hypothetical protein